MVDKFVGGWLGVVVLIVLCVVFFPLIIRVFRMVGEFFTTLLIVVLCFVFSPLIIVVFLCYFFGDDDD
ncbi:hypothetical protein ID0203_09960 [Helicobacter pylori]|nr:hypothetical protein KVD45_05790 [Helicobacter pylori]